MFALLVIWAACGTTAAFLADDLPANDLREWTDASGARRARAALVRVEGDKLWLRRPDGKLATTTIERLSETDRQYVASRRVAVIVAEESEPASPVAKAAEAVTETVTDAVEKIPQLPGWPEPSQSGDDSTAAAVPAALVYVRVSRRFLEDYVERSVRKRDPVRDCILGARIVGESETRGKTQLTLLPSSGRLLGRISFEGTVHSVTRGYKGPVIIHNVSDSTFKAHKTIAMDDSGLRVAPATATAQTQLRLTGVNSTLPRLRGRIATRIGWRRASQSHGQAEAITADHTADDVRQDFDERINRSMAKVQRVLGSKIPELEHGRRPMATDVRFRSSKDSVEVAILREDATAEAYKLRPPPAKENSDIAVRVHRTLFTTAMEDPELMQNLSPLFQKLLEARADRLENDRAKSASGGAAPNPSWEVNRGWLSLDFKDADR
jgi:hypothetical protein